MPAAAKLLHDDLHVDLAQRSGADVRAAHQVARCDKARLDALDGQQFVRDLRVDDLRVLGSAVVDGERHAFVVDHRGVVTVGFEFEHLVADLEQFLDLLAVRADALEPGRRLERTDPGLHREAVRVDHDAGEQRVRFALEDVPSLHGVLQDLGDEFRRAGGVAFHIAQGRGLGLFIGLSVVIDDHGPDGLLPEFGAFADARTVGVDHDQHALFVEDLQGLFAGDDLMVALFKDLVIKERKRFRDLIDHDIRPLAALSGQAVHAERRAEGVHVGVLVPHDQDVARAVDEALERVADDAGFAFAALFDGSGGAAVVGQAVIQLDDDLVAAAALGHVERLSGELFVLPRVLAGRTDADADRHGEIRFGRDLAHVVQDVELGAFLLVDIFLFYDQQIPSLPDLRDARIHLRPPLPDFAVDLTGEDLPVGVFGAVQQLREVVHIHDDRVGALVDVADFEVFELRYVGERQGQVERRAGQCADLHAEVFAVAAELGAVSAFVARYDVLVLDAGQGKDVAARQAVVQEDIRHTGTGRDDVALFIEDAHRDRYALHVFFDLFSFHRSSPRGAARNTACVGTGGPCLPGCGCVRGSLLWFARYSPILGIQIQSKYTTDRSVCICFPRGDGRAG